MFNVNQITARLRGMEDPELQKYAMMHKNNPYILPLAVNESSTRKEVRAAKQAEMLGQQQPKVVDQDIAQMMAPPPQQMPPQQGQPQMPPPQRQQQLPENIGIGQLPAPNMQRMADGGIAGYADGGEVAHFRRGGVPDDDVFNQAFLRTLKYEGGRTNDTGGDTKYGISKKGNPDVDIDKLTVEGARRLYKERYWDAISGDKLAARDPKLAQAAFDTAVNQGVSKAKQFVTESGGDVSKLMQLRGEHYDNLAQQNPKKYGEFAKGWMNRLGNLATDLAIPSAVAGEIPSAEVTKAKAPAEKEDAGLSTLVPATAVAGAGTAGTALPMYEALGATFKPGTTLKEALTRTGVASAVPAATFLGGAEATKIARNNLKLMSPEQRKELSDNPMLSAMSGDTGLAAAIMNAGQSKEPPPSMPYLEQMGNVGALIGNTALGRKGMGVGALLGNGPKEIEPMKMGDLEATDRSLGQVQATPDDKALKTQIDALKTKGAEDTAGEKKGSSSGSFFNDPMGMLGLQLLANKNPNLLGALGEAGQGTAKYMSDLRKSEAEQGYYGSKGKEASALADLYNRGAKDRNMQLEAEKLVQKGMEDWTKSMAGKMGAIRDPQAAKTEEARIRSIIYQQLGINPIQSDTNVPTSGAGFKFLGARP